MLENNSIKWDYSLSCFALDQSCCCRNTTSGKNGKLNSSLQLQFSAFWKWIYCHIVEGSSTIQECLEFSWSTNLPAWTYVHLLEEHYTRSMEASWKCLCSSTSSSLSSYPCQMYTVYRTPILRKRIGTIHWIKLPTYNHDGLIHRSVAALIYSETWSSQSMLCQH
jgi:hypothetical protein